MEAGFFVQTSFRNGGKRSKVFPSFPLYGRTSSHPNGVGEVARRELNGLPKHRDRAGGSSFVFPLSAAGFKHDIEVAIHRLIVLSGRLHSPCFPHCPGDPENSAPSRMVPIGHKHTVE